LLDQKVTKKSKSKRFLLCALRKFDARSAVKFYGIPAKARPGVLTAPRFFSSEPEFVKFSELS